MDFLTGARILLTGAGLTANFGAPLANELASWILSDPGVQEEPRVRELFLKGTDFESAYHMVMAGAFTPSERAAISGAIKAGFERLDEIVRGYRYTSEVEVDPNDVCYLFRLFGPPPKKGVIFTLNQDLFGERHGFATEVLLPGVEIRCFDPQERLQDVRMVPSGPELESLKRDHLERGTLCYVKLHGSQNWQSSTRGPLMVIGSGKAQRIDEEPLLKWYYNLFTKALMVDDRRLLVIGYGFGDEHINSVIADAAKVHHLRVYVLSPQNMSQFLADYNAPGKLDRGISYKAVSEPRRRERSWRHSATTTVPSSKPR